MALFQPTNVIPSTFTDGVVDANDTAQISWQVNGNSAMTAYRIDFYQNDTDSTGIPGATTGKLTVDGGFYGTDRFGHPKMFTWTAGGDTPKKWKEYDAIFTNGKEFKFKITLYWKEHGEEKSITQIEANVFITRDRPVCTISRSDNENFTGATSFPTGSTLPASIGYFVGNYTQAQGAPVRDVRWQVATWTNADAGEILADTGDVDTPTLQYEFNGFFISNDYAVRCSGKADYQNYGTQDFDSGWVNFTAKIPDGQQSEYTGNFNVKYLPKENAALLEWEGIEVIPPTFSDGFKPAIPNGSATIPAGASITWSQKGTEDRLQPINFAAPWSVGLKIEPKSATTTQSSRPEGKATTVNTLNKIFRNIAPDMGPVREGAYYVSTFTIRPDETFAKIVNDGAIEVRSGDVVNLRVFASSYSDYDDGRRVYMVRTDATAGVPTSATITGLQQIRYSVAIEVEFDTDIVAAPTVKDLATGLANKTIAYRVSSYNGKIVYLTLYGNREGATVSATVTVERRYFLTEDKVLEIGGSGIKVGINENGLSFSAGDIKLRDVVLATTSNILAAVITPTTVQAFSYPHGVASSTTLPISYEQKPTTSVAIFGGENGVTFDAVSVFQGNGEDVIALYRDSTFKPMWNGIGYVLYMSANFNGSFEGGTGTASGIGFRIYRQEVGSSVLTPIASVDSNVTALKDFGIRSRRAYNYSLYAYDSNQAFMQSTGNDTVVATCFKNYSLLVCDYDSKNDAYHVRKQYLFSLNLAVGSVGNNNTPTLNKNFTSYPTRMPDTANYASGTLQGLIGAIYTVPALIEQVGGIKHLKKASTQNYFDNVDLEKELYDLSVAPYQLFLRDMEGHLRMVSTNNQISMTPDLKKRQLPKTISFPWVEVGDASDVTIIQTPDDYGWNYDDQALGVKLDVNPMSGVLTAYYPTPYAGTRFYLTGVNREILGAETPAGITPAQFGLSDVAEQPDDGTAVASKKSGTGKGGV